jgi:Rad3-related DNA helicase
MIAASAAEPTGLTDQRILDDTRVIAIAISLAAEDWEALRNESRDMGAVLRGDLSSPFTWRRADIVIANHALVMAQAAFDGARSIRGAPEDSESTHLRRVIFDEGHHLFDAADSAFSTALSGQEAVELRRWIRGSVA